MLLSFFYNSKRFQNHVNTRSYFIIRLFSELSISASSPSVKAGAAATLTCSVEASDVGDHSNNHFAIYWIHPTNNDTFRNTIATTMAQMPLEDGVTMVTTSTLSISRFNSGDAGLYSCRVLYDEPIRDEHSAELYLGIGNG